MKKLLTLVFVAVLSVGVANASTFSSAMKSTKNAIKASFKRLISLSLIFPFKSSWIDSERSFD